MHIATCEVPLEIYRDTIEWVDDDGVQYYWPNQLTHRLLASEKKVMARKKVDPLRDELGNEPEYKDQKVILQMLPQITSYNKSKIAIALKTKGLGIHKIKLKLLIEESDVKLHT